VSRKDSSYCHEWGTRANFRERKSETAGRHPTPLGEKLSDGAGSQIACGRCRESVGRNRPRACGESRLLRGLRNIEGLLSNMGKGLKPRAETRRFKARLTQEAAIPSGGGETRRGWTLDRSVSGLRNTQEEKKRNSAGYQGS